MVSVLDALETRNDEPPSIDCAIVSTMDPDFAQSWNRTHADLLQRFPLELRVSCLRWLEPEDVLSVSHVSRDWRATSLSEPILWDSFNLSLSIRTIGAVGDCIDAMLHRSRSVPFDFSWFRGARMSARVMALLIEHASRFRHVVLYNQSGSFVSNMLDRPMLYLRTLEATGLDGPVQISATWNDSTVPHLRTLTLPGILFPDNLAPISSVRSLTLENTDNCRRLFETFPNVQTVNLQGVTSSTTLLPLELPRSLVSFSISAGTDDDDHSIILQSSRWRRLRNMHLHSMSVALSVHWFTNNLAGGWKLTLRCLSYDTVVIKMEDDEQHTLHNSIPYRYFRAVRFADLEIHLTQLTALTLAKPDEIISCTYGLTLPALRFFTLRLNNERETYWLRNWLLPRADALSAPALRVLTFQYPQHRTVVVSVALAVISGVPSIIATGDHPFPTLQFVGAGASVLCKQGIYFEWNFCEQIELEDTATGSTVFLIPPRQPEGVQEIRD
ncbi:hypothetical protein EXIGLDRAFT_837333 [Exidia glandulosa HHB12029]|uniref:F-box domain-containing protein n=1 Tax=Exidia glandulosa HHB12029 TaxID=1314781 RepID=A0A166AEI0_EXIGL|nr:hypothetical protein EXIGLDRAFT_837333 [Exidia glandulosa HHB12029]